MTSAPASGTKGGSRGTGGWGSDGLFLAILAPATLSVNAVNALSTIENFARVGRPVPAWEPWVWEITSGLVLIALAPAVLWISRRHPPRQPLGLGWLAPHLAGALAFSLVHVTAMGALRAAIYAAVDQRYDPLRPLGNWPYELRKDVLIYLGMVALYTVWRAVRPPPAALAHPVADTVLEVRDGARLRRVPVADILWVEAAGNYVELHRMADAVLHRASLAEMQQRLAPAGFVRIHRSRLVNRAMVAEFETNASGDFTARLLDGRSLAGSRRYRKAALDPASAPA